MQAIIVSIEGNRVNARVRRSGKIEGVSGLQCEQVKVGDKIEVKRRANDPFLNFIKKIS